MKIIIAAATLLATNRSRHTVFICEAKHLQQLCLSYHGAKNYLCLSSRTLKSYRTFHHKYLSSKRESAHDIPEVMQDGYKITNFSDFGQTKRILVSLSGQSNHMHPIREVNDSLKIHVEEESLSHHESSSALTNAVSSVPESVLQYERQMRKIQVLDRASRTNISVEKHLKILYTDEHLVVANKPSGILCVPGVNRHRSLLDLVFEVYGSEQSKGIQINGTPVDTSGVGESMESTSLTVQTLPRDSMIVHRLDMDTSGVVVFARTHFAMSKLHELFREKKGVKKVYEALLVGWLDINKWLPSDNVNDLMLNTTYCQTNSLGEGEIHLPLQRDHKYPPFMRVSTSTSEMEALQAVKDLNHAGWKKLVAKRAKPSITHFRILSHEKWLGHPVTRIELSPITGRTHQLRVHCAALGHPILGDPAYGYFGEANPNGGFTDEEVSRMSPTCAEIELRQDVEISIRKNERTMCLHARKLELLHPVTNQHLVCEALPLF